MFYEFEHFKLSENISKKYGKNLNFSSHIHQSFEIMAVLSGNMKITVDNKEHFLREGEAVLIFPNQIHSMTSRDSSHMVCIFSPELIRAFTTKTAGKIPSDNRFALNKYLLDSIDSLTEKSSLIEKKGVLYSLCAAFDKGAEYVERKENDKNLLYKIFLFVELNYNKDCSLNRLSQETGYSYSYLSRYFKKIVGISFNDYVNQYRINNACYLLGNSECTVLQCALDSGYDSLRSFNRNFMEHMSVTPGEYRKHLKI